MPLHGLRHSHATLLLQAGTHPRVVMERLGHSSIRVTLDTYSHGVGGLQELSAQNFDDFIEAKRQSVSRIKKSGIGVRGFEPPTTRTPYS